MTQESSSHTLRVAHVVPVLSIGGIRSHIEQIISKTSTEISNLIVPIFAHPSRPLQPVRGAELFALNLPLEYIEQPLLITKAIANTLFEKKANVVHSHHVYADIYSLPASGMVHCNALRTVHGITQFSPGDGLAKRALRTEWSKLETEQEFAGESFCNMTICVSNDVRTKIVNYGFHPEKLRVIHNGVDTEIYKRPSNSLRTATRNALQIDLNDFVLGFLGRFEPAKNPLACVHIASQLRRCGSRPIKFLLQGRGPQEPELRQEIDRFGLTSSVLIRPEAEGVDEFYSAIDVLVTPSLSEGLPYVALEAMSCEIPVVGSAAGGLLEMLKEGQTGFLFDPYSPENAVEKILPLFEAEFRKSIGRQSRMMVTEHFNVEDKVYEIEDIYRQISSRVER